MGIFNLRKTAYFALFALRGQPLGANYERILREDREGIPPDTTKRLLIRLLDHCKANVPYYSNIMQSIGGSYIEEPEEYLRRLPILNKETIREHFDQLKSADLGRRKWVVNHSGGSTGMPVRFIQDWDYFPKAGAISLLFSKLVGKEIGESEINLWGSGDEIIRGSERLASRFINKLTNTIFLNVFHMSPDKMARFIHIINLKRPRLIVAYANAIYELALFAEQKRIKLIPQVAIISTAGTLFPFMRRKLEEVFQCKVFNRYGSREVGDIAIERPGVGGLWVAPWGNYVEILDMNGKRVPTGCPGEVHVTNLSNYAMPFIRYKIGDVGILRIPDPSPGGIGQILQDLSGRVTDCILKANGDIVLPEFFIHMVGVSLNKGWIRKFQVVQEDIDIIHIFISPYAHVDNPYVAFDSDLLMISKTIRKVMGDKCKIIYFFVNDIPPTLSGKYAYIVSNVLSKRK
jgi:phenylacetate-CoA ligase